MMGSLVKEDLSVLFDEIEDPRINRRKLYPLCEILFLALFGALLGVESWRGLELLGNERLNLLQRFFPFVHGIPSHQTIARVFSILRPKSFEQFFIAWMAHVNGSNEGKQIALDGKTLRGSYDKSSAKEALHLLNACAVDNGICLGQMEVDTKTNEITVVPKMLDALDIKGAMISVDALNTQKEIATQIIDAEADYTLALKGNHKILNEEVQAIFAAKTEKNPQKGVTQTEKEHGRLTTRIYDVEAVDKYNLSQFSEWDGLKAVGRVQTTVLHSGKETQETRYYLLSYEDVNCFEKSARGHWAVESKLHWTLDVTFGEDASRKRKDHAPRNYSLIRKFGLNIIRTFKGKLSVPLFHIKMNANAEFMSSILQKAGFSLLESYSF
jgi:predicted transposase YbfD/YdcC